MKQADVEKIKEGIEFRYKTKIEKAESVRKSDLAALDKVLELLRTPCSAGARAVYGSITPSVLAAIDKAPAIFTKQDIHRLLSRDMKMSNITNCLRRLCKKGKVVLLENGYGSLPSKYSLPAKD